MTKTWELDAESGEAIVARFNPPVDQRATILYLHGFASSQGGEKAERFRGYARAMGLGFCSLDFRGHGSSGGSMLQFSLTRCLSDVTRVEQRLRREISAPVVLLGSSFGALAGLWFAAQSPQRVSAGLFIAPALGIERRFVEELGAEGMDRWRHDGRLEIEHELGAMELGWIFAEDFGNYPLEQLEERCRIPSLLLQGVLDDRVSWRQVVEFAGRCRGDVECHLFARGDHRLIEYADRLWKLMVEFLGGRDLL